jgi:hypothetical protein
VGRTIGQQAGIIFLWSRLYGATLQEGKYIFPFFTKCCFRGNWKQKGDLSYCHDGQTMPQAKKSRTRRYGFSERGPRLCRYAGIPNLTAQGGCG